MHGIYCKHERGQGLMEYALIMMLVAMVVILVLIVLGPTVGNLYSTAIEMFPD